MIQQLIDMMENGKVDCIDIGGQEGQFCFDILTELISKAKELQSKEKDYVKMGMAGEMAALLCKIDQQREEISRLQGKEKWVVVDKSATFNSKEDAEQHFYTTFCNNLFHTIVKIIEP